MGVVEKDEMPSPENIKPGDLLVGLPSSGIHSNGYSLVRKIIADKNLRYDQYDQFLGGVIGEVLLTPTRIYVKYVLKLKEEGVNIKGLAHITGGGIPGNLVRILPENVTAVVEKEKLPKLRVFEWIQKLGEVPEEEMFKTFNMGVGMILVTDEENARKILSLNGEARIIGKLVEGKREVKIV